MSIIKKLSVVWLSSCMALSAWSQEVAIVIHGGAGTILQASMTPEREAEYVILW